MRARGLYSGLFLLCISLISASCSEQGAPQTPLPLLAIRIVDETVDGNSRQGPQGTDRVPQATWDGGTSGALWLKREGGMEGPFVAEAHVDTAVDGTSAVRLTFTPEGREQFAALTRTSIGHRLAFVLNGRVIVSALIGAEIGDGMVEINGAYTEMEAQALVAELITASQAITQ